MSVMDERGFSLRPDDDISTAPLCRIVCAAMAMGTIVIPGVRHKDENMRHLFRCIGFTPGDWTGFVAGFLTNTGEFRDRQKAWPIAEAAGQIRQRIGQVPGELHSEDLY